MSAFLNTKEADGDNLDGGDQLNFLNKEQPNFLHAPEAEGSYLNAPEDKDDFLNTEDKVGDEGEQLNGPPLLGMLHQPHLSLSQVVIVGVF